MNERPTPETDAEHAQFAMGGFTLDFCRKLERERDEAREDLEFRRGLYKVLEESNNRLMATNEEAAGFARKLERERNEAREQLAAAKHFLEKYIAERDEARELCRELIDLVAYGLGQSGQEWSLDAMRQARETIQKAKALEAK